MDPIILQLSLALAMLLTTAAAGLLPLKLVKLINRASEESRRASWVLTLLSCFGGGVFIGTCFLDIIPHVQGNYVKFHESAGWTTSYPLPLFMSCVGFFLVYFLEEVFLKIFSADVHGHVHEPVGGNVGNDSGDNVSQILPAKTLGTIEENNRGRTASVTDASTPYGYNNGSKKMSTTSQMSYIAKTHEIVMDETVKYLSNEHGSLLKSITFAIAMSFHSVLEGFALGVQDEQSGILTLFLSLIIHKGIEAFSVGLQITRANSRRTKIAISTVLVYALMTPIGSIIGLLLLNSNIDPLTKEGFTFALEGLAGGTFIYVTFFEVLAQERANDHSNLVQLAAIVAGFSVIAGFQLVESQINGGVHVH